MVGGLPPRCGASNFRPLQKIIFNSCKDMIQDLHSCADSSTAEQPAFQPGDGGSIPTSALHVFECSLTEVQSVIERVHYTHSIFGVTASFCFGVSLNGLLCGGAVFGPPAGNGAAKKCAPPQRIDSLNCAVSVLSTNGQKNAESRVIGSMLRSLGRKGVTHVLSYADPAQGHTGVIYKATGFEHLGKTSSRKHFSWRGKTYPDRNLHQTKFPLHLQLRTAVRSGEAQPVKIPGKLIYLKRLSQPLKK